MYVPAPVALDAIAVHRAPNETSSISGYLEPLRYYAYTPDPQVPYWMHITNPYGLSGWVDLRQVSNLIRVGNLLQSDLTDPRIEEIIAQSHIATLTTLDQLEPEQLQILQSALDQEGLQLVVQLADTAAFLIENFPVGDSVAKLDLICLPNTALGLVHPNVASEIGDMVCTLLELTPKNPNPFFALATITANPDLYIDSWYLPLQTQFLDRVSGACLFADLFIDSGGGDYCEGKNEFDFWQ